jgi:uncharacterized protein with PIN domain
MLGGLARWLRAAGYEAEWREHIEDPELIRLAHRSGQVLLSSDTGIFKTGIVRDGEVRSVLVPHGLTIQGQLAHVLKTLGLPLRAPRCSACGGTLKEVPKEQVRERVPPRTFAWINRFWECSACAQLFWHGTHWQRILEQLRAAGLGTPPPPHDSAEGAAPAEASPE